MDWRERREDYERQVVGLAEHIAEMRARGVDWEIVARELVGARNNLKLEVRVADDPEDVFLMEMRGRRLYHSAIGPTADTLSTSMAIGNSLRVQLAARNP